MARDLWLWLKLHNFGIIEENREWTNKKWYVITQSLERSMFMATQWELAMRVCSFIFCCVAYKKKKEEEENVQIAISF